MLTPADLHALESWQELESRSPLATAILWHHDDPGRTSQRRPFLNFHELLMLFVLGGNRTGKSEGGGQLAVAMALGRGHPDVRAWLDNNRLPRELIPGGPGLVWATALTHKDSREYVRAKIARYAPAGTEFRRWEADDEAEARFPGGGRIVCKAVKQGRKAFQGQAYRLLWFDEEPWDFAVVEEGMRGLIDHGGRALFTMTCLEGWTRLLKRYVRQPGPDTEVHYLDSYDNPHVSNENIDRILSIFDEQTAETRRTGKIRVLKGQIYPMFHRGIHVVKPFLIPRDWTRIRAWDAGTRNPTHVVWMARDPSDDTVYVYREHTESQWTTRQHAERVIELSLGEPIEATVVDPAAAQVRLDLTRDHDIPTVKGVNAVGQGINHVKELLKPDVEGKPHLLFFDTCPVVVEQIEQYRWKKGGPTGDPREEPLKEDDHGPDAVRYGVMYFKLNAGFQWY